ncbi:MAG: glycosyltransferase [Methanobacteriota archaeon]
MPRGRRILMLVANPATHDPRVRAEAEALAGAGNDVTILAWDRRGVLRPEERTGGVRIVRVRNTAWMRLLPLDLLRLRPFWRLLAAEGARLHGEAAFDAVHAHDFDTLPAGVALKRRLGLPLVYDAHEIWGYVVEADLPGSGAFFLARERRLLPEVDWLVTVNTPLAEFYGPLVRAPVTVVMNAKAAPTRAYEPPKNDGLVALYLGTLNEARWVHGLVDAADGLAGVRLVIGGGGPPPYVERLKRRVSEASNARFVGLVPGAEVLDRTREADVVVLPIDPAHRLIRLATANKQFEAMSAGRPILVTKGTFPGRFTEEHGVGITVEHSVEGFRQGLVRLRDDPELRDMLGRAALEKARGEFNWETQGRRLVEGYEALLAGRGGAG